MPGTHVKLGAPRFCGVPRPKGANLNDELEFILKSKLVNYCDI